MRSVLILLLTVVLAGAVAGCAKADAVADMPIDNDETIESPAGPESGQTPETTGYDASNDDGTALEDPGSTVSASIVRSVRDVYAVLEPEVVDGYVVIGGSVLNAFEHVRFAFTAEGESYDFFGYVLNGEFIVRAAVCPCCGSDELAHGGTSLVCHACGVTYGLSTGEASDECGFPAGEVPYIEDIRGVKMLVTDLVEAFQRTAAGEADLFEPEPEPVDNEVDDTSWPRCCRR